MKDKEKKATMNGILERNLGRPSDRRPVWKKISSLPDMMIRPDERQNIRTFVNGSMHNNPLLTKKTESFESYCKRQLAIDQAMSKFGDRTTRNLRALLSPSNQARSRSPVAGVSRELRTIALPFSTQDLESGSVRSKWSQTKQTKKSAMERTSATGHKEETCSSGWHDPNYASKQPTMFERAASKKRDGRWDASTKVGQGNQREKLKSPKRHASTDNLSVASSMPPLTACDFEDCTQSASVDLGSLDELSERSPRDNVKENLRKGSTHADSSRKELTNSSGEKFETSDETLTNLDQTSSKFVKKVLNRVGSDCSPTTASQEFQSALTETSSSKIADGAIQSSIRDDGSYSLSNGSLLCSDISTRIEDRQEANQRFTDSIPPLQRQEIDSEVEKKEYSLRLRSTRSRSLSPHQMKNKDDRSRSLSSDSRKKSRSRSRSVQNRKTKEHPVRSRREVRDQRTMRSGSNVSGSTRRKSGNRDITKKKHVHDIADEQSKKPKEPICQGSRRPSKGRRVRSTSPTKRNRSKLLSKSGSSRSGRLRSESRSNSRSRTPRRHRSSSRTKPRSPSSKPSRSKSMSKRRKRKELHGQTTTAKKQETNSLQTSCASIEANFQSLYTFSCPNQDPLSSSLTALVHIAATRKAVDTTTPSLSKIFQQINSTLPAPQKREQEIIPISSLLPPKKTCHRVLLKDSSCASLQLNDLDVASTSAETVKQSNQSNSSSLNDRSNKNDRDDGPKSTLIRTGSTQAMVKRWEEEIMRSARPSPTSTLRETITCARMQRRGSTGTAEERVEQLWNQK
jgi:hypothetical protein